MYFQILRVSPTSFIFFCGFILTAVLNSSCSSTSALIRTDDTVFPLAQTRLQQSIQLIEESKAPAAERSLFLQAESFYRYRYEPPPRDLSYYLISTASAITDFPGFQAVAGSMNLLDLRLRSSDSAVQLWETLLQRFPDSKLRPLALYRLGWAYRMVGATGFPRSSPNEPFDLLIQEQPHTDLAKLALEAKEIPWKSKSAASTRSFAPGLGQIYVGETRSGIVRLAVAAVSLLAIAVPVYQATRQNHEQNWSQDGPQLALGLGGLIVLSFDYTNSYEDAMRGVVDWNERQELEFNRSHPKAP